MTATKSKFAILIAAMATVVLLSNILVQYPVQAMLGGVNIADILTWGAFTYPIAFLVTDLTNRIFGVSAARKVVFVGFLVAVVLSIWFATPRIAIASGSAFLVAQLLDVSIFDRLRSGDWWRAPLVSSLLGSVIDTLLFFSIAFAPMFGALDFGGADGSLGFGVPFLGFGSETPLWVSLACGDFIVKILVGLAMLVPYGFLSKQHALA